MLKKIIAITLIMGNMLLTYLLLHKKTIHLQMLKKKLAGNYCLMAKHSMAGKCIKTNLLIAGGRRMEN